MAALRPLAAAAALTILAPLAGCGGSEENASELAAESAAASDRTLAGAIAEAPGLTTVSGALTEAGLADVFDGRGSYTVLAPDDDAFAKLGASGKLLTDPAHRAELVGLLRGHILPGHLTPDAIRKAIAARNGPVTMRNLADGEVTFSAAGDAITVSGEDGTKATIDGEALVASNGVVLPLDGVVKRPSPVPAS